MIDALFPISWWLIGIAAAAGVSLFISGNNRQQTQLRNAGIGLAALAIILVLLNHFIETDQQKATRQTHSLIQAVVDKDLTTLQNLMDPKVSLSLVAGNIYANRDDLIKGVQDSVDRYGLKSATSTSTQTKQDQSGIVVDVDLLTFQDYTAGRPVPSSWRFDWEKTDTGWKVYRITCLKIGDQNAGQVLRNLIGK